MIISQKSYSKFRKGSEGFIMLVIRKGEIDFYQFTIFSKFVKLIHFTSCKNGMGENNFSLSLSSVNDPGPIIKNRIILAQALNLQPENFVFQQQEHTNNVTIVKKKDGGRGFFNHVEGIANNDALVTDEKEICLMIMGADCVPILFYDPVKEVIAAAHTGWRGSVQRIAVETVKSMVTAFNCNPANILAAIGPSIGPKNYEVDQPVFDAFCTAKHPINEIFRNGIIIGKYYLDLWKANELQLLSMGLKSENVEISGISTFDNNRAFFSARKGDSGRFGTGIMLV